MPARTVAKPGEPSAPSRISTLRRRTSDVWMRAPWEEAMTLQGPFADYGLVIVRRGADKEDEAAKT